MSYDVHDRSAFAFPATSIMTVDDYTGEDFRKSTDKVRINGQWVSQDSKEYKRYHSIVYSASKARDYHRENLYKYYGIDEEATSPWVKPSPRPLRPATQWA